jgi:hypothetical protein
MLTKMGFEIRSPLMFVVRPYFPYLKISLPLAKKTLYVPRLVRGI